MTAFYLYTTSKSIDFYCRRNQLSINALRFPHAAIIIDVHLI